MLRERLVQHVESDTLGPVPFDPNRYNECIGLIVLDQVDTTPFVASPSLVSPPASSAGPRAR